MGQPRFKCIHDRPSGELSWRGTLALAEVERRYLEHVLERWRAEALREVRDEQLETPEYPSSWRTRYAIDSMLEHAVMHPIRHAFQLDELIRNH